jgi:uncharacterized protein YmfQ (DUF2313 family)
MIRAAIDLRHTLISWMVRRVGITPAVLAYAGHSSYQMASRVYAHAMQPQLHEVVAAAESMEHERRPAVSSTFCEEFERIDRDPDEGEPPPAAPATALGRAA